jgi:hypothetical protein
MGVDIEIDYAQLGLFIRHTTDEHAQKAANRVQERARFFATKRTGAMAAGIRVELVGIPGEVTTYEVYPTADYAEYQEYGTGPIFAKPGSFLVWEEHGVRVFAKRTRGVPAVHFMRRAAALGTILDFIAP